MSRDYEKEERLRKWIFFVSIIVKYQGLTLSQCWFQVCSVFGHFECQIQNSVVLVSVLSARTYR